MRIIINLENYKEVKNSRLTVKNTAFILEKDKQTKK